MQAPHRFLISLQHGDRQGGLAPPVFRFEIGTQLDQQIEDVVPLSTDGEVKRRQAMLEAREAAIERLRILFGHIAHECELSHRHCREDVVARSALEQERNQRLP